MPTAAACRRCAAVFPNNKSELKDLIDSVKPSDTASDLSESLLLAATSLRAVGGEGAATGAAKTEAISAGKIWLFSDGSGVKVPDAMGGADNTNLLQFVRIGSSDHSVGITRLAITPVPKEDKTYQVFVGLKNAWNVDKRVGILLAYGTKDNFLPDQSQFVNLPAGAAGSVVFEKVTAEPGKLFVRVDDRDDDFPLDNTAYGIIAPPRKVRVVLVTRGNDLLENLVKTAVRVGEAEGQILAPESYDPKLDADLFILDGFVPPADKLPKADTMLIRPRVVAEGDVAGFKVTHLIENPIILRARREDPLMQFVELGELHIGQALLMDKDPGAIELVSSPEGPLIAYKDVGSARRYFLSFSPLVESNWWRIPSFIIFMQNVIEETRLRHYIGMPELLAAGTPARLWNVGDDKGEGAVRITLPDGSSGDVQAKDGSAEFGETDKVGFYEVASASGKKQLFAINLLNPVESDIRPQSLQTAPGSNVEETTSVATVNKEIWRWLAAAALAVLLLEWWVYHRRIA